jgi:hypothetical protein
MPLLDTLQDGLARVLRAKKSAGLPAMSAGIGSGGHGMVPFEDDMIVSKPTIIFHTSQIFFNFLAMCCFASVAGFQAKRQVGPSGLTGFTLFITIAGIFLSTFMLLVPVIYEKYDKLMTIARLMKEVRVGFILTGTGTIVSLLISFIVTISAWTEPGCKNPDNDPNQSKGDAFKNGLSGWCSTKKAGAIFLWLAFSMCLSSLTRRRVSEPDDSILGGITRMALKRLAQWQPETNRIVPPRTSRSSIPTSIHDPQCQRRRCRRRRRGIYLPRTSYPFDSSRCLAY